SSWTVSRGPGKVDKCDLNFGISVFLRLVAAVEEAMVESLRVGGTRKGAVLGATVAPSSVVQTIRGALWRVLLFDIFQPNLPLGRNSIEMSSEESEHSEKEAILLSCSLWQHPRENEAPSVQEVTHGGIGLTALAKLDDRDPCHNRQTTTTC